MDPNIIDPRLVGYLAGALTALSMFPQVIKSYKTRRMDEFSLAYLLVMFSGLFLWLLYGVIIGDLPLIFSVTVSSSLSAFLLLMKILDIKGSGQAK